MSLISFPTIGQGSYQEQTILTQVNTLIQQESDIIISAVDTLLSGMKKENELLGPLLELNFTTTNNFNPTNNSYIGLTATTTNAILNNLNGFRSTPTTAGQASQIQYQTASNYYALLNTGPSTGTGGAGTGQYIQFNTDQINAWVQDQFQSDFLSYLDLTAANYNQMLGWYVRGVLMLQGQQQGTTLSSVVQAIDIKVYQNYVTGTSTAFSVVPSTGTQLGSTRTVQFVGNTYNGTNLTFQTPIQPLTTGKTYNIGIQLSHNVGQSSASNTNLVSLIASGSLLQLQLVFCEYHS